MSLLPTKCIPTAEELLQVSKRYPALDPLSTLTFLRVLVTADELFRGAGETFQKFQISKGRAHVLMQLINKTDGSSYELSPAEMATAGGVTRATISGLLDGLEREGLVIRKPAPNDRRGVLVSLTESGLEMMEEFLPQHFQRINALTASLTTAEKEQLQGLLDKICSQVSSVASDDFQLPNECSH